MNIVKTGNTYKIFDNAVQTGIKLPNLTFKVVFDPMSGYSLLETDSLKVTEKVYGNIPNRVNKILKTFSMTERNLGVILSGTKGCGKSLTARLISSQNLYPTILVDNPTPGLDDFLSSIKQEVIVIFDEFEKHFTNNNDGNSQEELLSLFDGIDDGKKLFVITCNETYNLNEFFLDRPGRFHYLFKYNNLTNDEIYDYLNDNIVDKTLIPDIIKYSLFVDFSYDALRAICFDLNLGYPLAETMDDLNISVVKKEYKLILTFANGEIYTRKLYCMPMSNYRDSFYFSIADSSARIEFNCADMIQQTDGSLIIPRADIKYTKDSDYEGDGIVLPEITECRFVAVNPYKAKFATIVA